MINKKMIIFTLIMVLTFNVVGCTNPNNDIDDSNGEIETFTEAEEIEEEMLSVKADEYEENMNEIEEEYSSVEEGYLMYFTPPFMEDNRHYFIEKHLVDVDNSPTYDDLIRYPQEWEGEVVKLEGEVIQVVFEEDNYYELLINTASGSSRVNMVAVGYTKGTNDPRILAGDKFIFWSNYGGIGEMENIFGQIESLPFLMANRMILNNQSADSLIMAIKDYESGIIYTLSYKGNSIVALDLNYQILWKYESLDRYHIDTMVYSEDGKIIVDAIKVTMGEDPVEGQFVFDKEGNILESPEDAKNILKE